MRLRLGLYFSSCPFSKPTSKLQGLPKKVSTGYKQEAEIAPQGLLIRAPMGLPISSLFHGVTSTTAFSLSINQFLFSLFARTTPSIGFGKE